MAPKKEKDAGMSCFAGGAMSCCQVEAVVGVDDKGQMVLPKSVRDRAGIRPGDKLVLVGWEKDGALCCITMLKAEALASMVKGMLGPVMKDILTP